MLTLALPLPSRAGRPLKSREIGGTEELWWERGQLRGAERISVARATRAAPPHTNWSRTARCSHSALALLGGSPWLG